MFRRIVAGREAFIPVVESVGTLFSSKDAISCHVRASRREVRKSQIGICILHWFYGGRSRRPVSGSEAAF